MGTRGGEIFVPFESPSRVPMLTHARSTLVVSAVQALRARGLYDRYQQHLAAETRERLLGLIAGQWIDVDLAVAHYRAADALGLDGSVVDEIGADVANRTGKSLLHTAVKLSKALGATPWTALSLSHKIREASWRGSDLAVFKLGPKEARYEWVGQPCAGVPYFARSFGSFMRALLALFCRTVHTRPVPELSSGTSLAVRISWV